MSSEPEPASANKAKRKPKAGTKAKEPVTARDFKSAAFINSEGDPVDALEGFEAEQPAKKRKKLDKSVASVPATDKQEAELAKLKNLVKTCGLRVPQKALSEMDSAQAISHLSAQLVDAGLGRPFTLAKAKKLKEETELARELTSLGGSRNVAEGSSRGQRRSGKEAASIINGVIAARDKDHGEEEVDEKAEALKDRRAAKNVSTFWAALQRAAE